MREVLRQIIARDGAERSATETLREEMDAPHRLDVLVPQYVHAIEMLGTERQQEKRDVLAGVFGQQQAAAMLADPAADALLAELNHHPDMAAAVTAAAAERELGSAESVTQVMQWRLEKLRSADAERALAGPLPWLPTVPDTATGELRDWTVTRAQVISERSQQLAELVDAERPAWAAPLGDRPVEPAAARDWDRAAALAAAYREQYKVTDDSSVLGPDQPLKGTQGRAWAAANNAVQAAHQSAQGGHTDQRASANRLREPRGLPADPAAARQRGRSGPRGPVGGRATHRVAHQRATRRDDPPGHPGRSAPAVSGAAVTVGTVTTIAAAEARPDPDVAPRTDRGTPAPPGPPRSGRAGHAGPHRVPTAAAADADRSGSGNQGRVRAAADEPTRVASPDIAAEETTPEAELPPENRPYAAVGDRALSARIKEAQATIKLTGSQIDAMVRRDEQRQTPLSASAAKMRERTRRSLQQQLDGAQTQLQEMTEEELRRAEHPELSVPDTAAELRANIRSPPNTGTDGHHRRPPRTSNVTRVLGPYQFGRGVAEKSARPPTLGAPN